MYKQDTFKCKRDAACQVRAFDQQQQRAPSSSRSSQDYALLKARASSSACVQLPHGYPASFLIKKHVEKSRYNNTISNQLVQRRLIN